MAKVTWDDRFKIFVLMAAVRWFNHVYYEKDGNEISDNTYDLLYRELQRLEAKNGGAYDSSPTQTPGH